MFFYIIQELCKAKSVTISHVLLELGMSKGNIANWKNGKLPSSQNLKKLADYFGVTTDFLLGNPNDVLEVIADQLYKQNINTPAFENYLDISSGSVEKWKNRTSTTFLNHLPKIADYLEVTVEYLLGYNFLTQTLKIDTRTLDDSSLLNQIHENPKIKKLIHNAIALPDDALDELLQFSSFKLARDISDQLNDTE